MAPQVSTDWIVALLGAGGFATIVSAVVAGVFSKRKISAEATEIITKAAAGVVTNMQAEIDRQVKRNEEMVREHRAQMHLLVQSHELEIQDVRRVLQLHVAWDAIAIAKMGELGIELPPAPPLLPARQSYPHHDLAVDLKDTVTHHPEENL
jgi:hypothetical protein